MPGEASDVQITIPRASFQEMRDFVKQLGQALDAAEMKVKADEKLAGGSLGDHLGDVQAAPPDPLAGFGDQLNQSSNQGMGY